MEINTPASPAVLGESQRGFTAGDERLVQQFRESTTIGNPCAGESIPPCHQSHLTIRVGTRAGSLLFRGRNCENPVVGIGCFSARHRAPGSAGALLCQSANKHIEQLEDDNESCH